MQSASDILCSQLLKLTVWLLASHESQPCHQAHGSSAFRRAPALRLGIGPTTATGQQRSGNSGTRLIPYRVYPQQMVRSPPEIRTGRVLDMVTAIVFVKAEVSQIPDVAEQIAALPGISEVYSVTGEIDLIAIVRVASHDQIAETVPDQLNKVAGVLSTETHIAFRTYSTHDLEAAFSLGST